MCAVLTNLKRLKRPSAALFLASFGLFLYAEPHRGFTSTESTQNSEAQSNPQTQGNFNGGLTALSPSLNWPGRPSPNPSDPWESLRNWIEEGLQGLGESNGALSQLESQLETLEAETQEQRLLLEESMSLLASLRLSLAEARSGVEVAADRMRDAEDYALWIEAQNELLKIQARRHKKSALVGFSIDGVSFGIGAPLAVEGIRSGNNAMLWPGAGVAGTGALVWAFGCYVFHRW